MYAEFAIQTTADIANERSEAPSTDIYGDQIKRAYHHIYRQPQPMIPTGLP